MASGLSQNVLRVSLGSFGERMRLYGRGVNVRHRVGLVVGFVLVIVAFVWTLIEATHAADFVERWIPKWMESMITPTFNLKVILVGSLLMGAAWIELRFGGHKHDLRRHKLPPEARTRRRPILNKPPTPFLHRPLVP